MTMPDLQWYLWNLNLIMKIMLFFWLKNSDNFSSLSFKQEMRQVTFAENPLLKTNSLRKKSLISLSHTWSNKDLNETVLNRTLPVLPLKLGLQSLNYSSWIINWCCSLSPVSPTASIVLSRRPLLFSLEKSWTLS